MKRVLQGMFCYQCQEHLGTGWLEGLWKDS